MDCRHSFFDDWNHGIDMDKIAYGIIVGLGKSGLSVVSFCKKNSIPFCAYDDKNCFLEGIDLLHGEEGLLHLKTASFPKNTVCVVAPGVMLQHPSLEICRMRNIPIISEIEFAVRMYKGPLPRMVAVTGSNGKTTVVSLIEHILREEGISCAAIGNIGVPVTEALHLTSGLRPDWYVVEISSFQLMTTHTPVFLHGACLNISSNHLNWHASFEEYVAAKLHLEDLILPSGTFLSHPFVPSDTGEKIASIPEFSHHFPQAATHDRHNFEAAYALLEKASCDISLEKALHHYKTFKKPPHRIQYVTTIEKVSFYNDSKSTNIASTQAAVAAVPGKIVLIAGGVHKGGSYLPWKDSFLGKVSKIFVIGQASSFIEQELGEFFPIEKAQDLKDATHKSFSFSTEPYSVLLSPGCSSYDMFSNYQERGDAFVSAVFELSEERR